MTYFTQLSFMSQVLVCILFFGTVMLVMVPTVFEEREDDKQ